MDEQQAARWAAAQREVVVGLDNPVAAARQHLEFLAEVDRRRWLYEGPLLDRAIHRYKACWLPLLAKHTQGAVVEGPLVVPLDCEWIWHCHRLNPVQYIRDCKKVYGRILDNDKVESSTRATSWKLQSENVWTDLYPEEPFKLEYNSSADTATDVNSEFAEGISYDLVAAVKRQTSFCYQVGTQTMYQQRFLEEALARYKGFLYLIKLNQEKGMQLFRVPTYDVDLMWHTHQLHPVTYRNDMLKLLGRVLEHDDTDADRSEGKKLDVGFTGTTEQFESTFGVRYWKAGAMYRGNLPSPVTSTPQIFSVEGDNGHVCEVERHLNVIQLAYVELFLQIVDIKNLPPAIPKESVYVWFTKNQPDKFISDGGRLDIVAITGKSIGVGLQCEPYGELVLTLMVDHGSKKSEQIGKVSIPLKELAGPGSVFSFERWLELKAHGGHATSPPISLRVAASSTDVTSAQHVLRMIRTEPFCLTTCLFPQSTKDQNMNIWTGFVYDFGTELIRLQLREHKAKDGMAFTREIVGVPKSSKKQFQLAEFRDNKWTLTDSTLSISDDIKPSSGDDGCILQLTVDNKLVKLYRGRRLEYQRKCCNNHSEDASAVTAVKFTAQQPYGKAIALLDTKSQLIMVDETWFLLPWIVISFLLTEICGEEGAELIAGTMVKKDAASGLDAAIMKPEAGAIVASGGANGQREFAGGCGGGCSGNCGPVFNTSTKVEHAKTGGCGGGGCSGACGNMVNLNTKAGQAESGGCGGGCGGGCSGACGNMVRLNTKAGHAESGGCGGGCSGACGNMINLNTKTGHAESGGCGGGCGGGCSGACGNMVNLNTKTGHAESGGAMVIEGYKGGNVKSGGCGSGCGSGCSGGCGAGTMVIEGSAKGGNVESSGCGSGCGGGGGCGGGCGGAMVVEGSKGSGVKAAGCGSGCGSGCGGGGGCGAMFKESTVASQAKSGGCGSGCGGGGCGGGGCGAVFRASTMAGEAKSGGCGSGCGGAGCGGGGCGAMLKESAMAGEAKSGGCGSGCGGGGCGGSGCGSMLKESSVTGQAKSSGCGSGCGGGGCGSGMVVIDGSDKASHTTHGGGCGSGCGSGCGGGGGCGAMLNA